MSTFVPWAAAMQDALYGTTGFYRRNAPADHFRTAAHSPVFADAVAQLVREVDGSLGRRADFTFVDMGSGGGELLALLAERLPERITLVGVDVPRATPEPDLPPRVTWTVVPPTDVVGVLFANEWLDNVPVDVVEVDEAGVPRLVLVDPATGTERLGDVVAPADPGSAWLDLWWPLRGAPAGARAEVGLGRDAAWTRAVARLRAGVAIAVDYGHDLESRPVVGTLTGYRRGRAVVPVPDGSMDLTAHVALDACAAAAQHATGIAGSIRTQRDVLRSLGVLADTVDRVDPDPHTDPAAYVRALARASEGWLLTSDDAMGDFRWLAHARSTEPPHALQAQPPSTA